MNVIRKAFRRWLFRRMWPGYRTPQHSTQYGTRPTDGQWVVVLDVDHPTPVWLAQYNGEYNSYQAGGGWFEAQEITYWAPIRGLEHQRITTKE